MRQGELVKDGREEDSPDPAIEILERMDGLKSSISPGKQLGLGMEIGMPRPNVAQPLSQIVAIEPDLDRHFVERRRRVCAHLHVHVAKSSGSIRKEPARQFFVTQAKPFRGNGYLFRLRIGKMLQNACQRNRQPLGHLRIRQGPFGGLEIASRA